MKKFAQLRKQHFTEGNRRSRNDILLILVQNIVGPDTTYGLSVAPLGEPVDDFSIEFMREEASMFSDISLSERRHIRGIWNYDEKNTVLYLGWRMIAKSLYQGYYNPVKIGRFFVKIIEDFGEEE